MGIEVEIWKQNDFLIAVVKSNEGLNYGCNTRNGKEEGSRMERI